MQTTQFVHRKEGHDYFHLRRRISICQSHITAVLRIIPLHSERCSLFIHYNWTCWSSTHKHAEGAKPTLLRKQNKLALFSLIGGNFLFCHPRSSVLSISQDSLCPSSAQVDIYPFPYTKSAGRVNGKWRE